MPVITIAGNENISIEDKREMVKKVSETVAKAYGLPIEAITVLVQAYKTDDIGVAANSSSNQKRT